MTLTSGVESPARPHNLTSTSKINVERAGLGNRLDETAKSDLTTALESSQPQTKSASTLRKYTSQWWRETPSTPTEAISGFQKWEGRVIEAYDEGFTVELLSLDDEQQSPVYADFEAHLLAPETVVPGDVVYVTARMVEHDHGIPAAKTLALRLRRLGNWTHEQLEDVSNATKAEWDELKDLFD